MPFLESLKPDDVVLFAGTHADDETLIGPLLAYCADHCREVVVSCMTRGESGHNLTREDLMHTLSQVREMEFRASVAAFGGTPVMFDYVNATSRAHPGGLAILDPDPQARERWRTAVVQTLDGVLARWTSQTGSPVEALLTILRHKRPNIVITLDLENGYTGHVEHVATAHATVEAVRAYNADAEPKAVLYCACDWKDESKDGESILTSDLNRLSGKDYIALAEECRAFYESQFGVRSGGGGGSYVAMRATQAMLVRVEAGW